MRFLCNADRVGYFLRGLAPLGAQRGIPGPEPRGTRQLETRALNSDQTHRKMKLCIKITEELVIGTSGELFEEREGQ